MPPSIIPENRLRIAMRNGQNVVGCMLVEIRQPSVMQLFANAGFNFVIIDGEHGPFTIETIADLSRAARQVGITPIVRVPDITYPLITQPLDAGAQGLMIPRITNAQQVRDVVQMMKYPPKGRRGAVLSRGHTDFRAGSIAEAMAKSNEETMLVVQIETKQAVENIEEILSVEGVNVGLIGPTDLSVALGAPGNMELAELHGAVESMISVCKKRGVMPAIHMNDLERAVFWAKKGMRMVSFNSETGLMMKAGMEATTTIRGAFPVASSIV